MAGMPSVSLRISPDTFVNEDSFTVRRTCRQSVVKLIRDTAAGEFHVNSCGLYREMQSGREDNKSPDRGNEPQLTSMRLSVLLPMQGSFR